MDGDLSALPLSLTSLVNYILSSVGAGSHDLSQAETKFSTICACRLTRLVSGCQAKEAPALRFCFLAPAKFPFII